MDTKNPEKSEKQTKKPKKYTLTEDDFIFILDEIAEGKSVTKTLQKLSEIKNKTIRFSQLYEFIQSKKMRQKRYEHAQEARADYLFSEIQDISDAETAQIIGKNGELRGDMAFEQHRKTKIEARKWIAAKLQPRYADRQQVFASAPISVKVVHYSRLERKPTTSTDSKV